MASIRVEKSMEGKIMRMLTLLAAVVVMMAVLHLPGASAQEVYEDSVEEASVPFIHPRQTKHKPSFTGKEHVIAVGRISHAFEPEFITAAVGDIVRFDFYPANHSVVRADFDAPCLPRERFNITGVNFYSGFLPVPDKLPPKLPSWYLKINSTEPLFFYCSAPESCNKYGMVGAINPTSKIQFTTFKEKAMTQHFTLSPGEPIPKEDGSDPHNPPPPSHNPSSSKHKLSKGAIAGITIGAIAILAGFILILYFLIRPPANTRREKLPPQGGNPAQSHPYDPYDPYSQAAAAGGYYSTPSATAAGAPPPQMQMVDPRMSYYPPIPPQSAPQGLGMMYAGGPPQVALGHPQSMYVKPPALADEGYVKYSPRGQQYVPVELGPGRYSPGLGLAPVEIGAGR